MIARIRNNFGLKVLAFVLALAAWGYLRYSANPIIAAQFDQRLSIPLATTGLSNGDIVHLSSRQVLVTVRPQHDRSTPIRPEDVRAVLDLAGAGPGDHDVPVTVDAAGMEVTSLTPATVPITIERMEDHALPIAVHYVGRPGSIVVGRASVSPAHVTVRGPSSTFAIIASVRVDVPLAKSSGTFDAMVRPVAVDKTGAPVADAAIAPNLVRVRVEFR